MKELRMKRLQKEVQERVIMNDGNLKQSFQDVLDHLYKEHELYWIMIELFNQWMLCEISTP